MNQSLFSVALLIALCQPCLSSAQPPPALADTSGQTMNYRPFWETQKEEIQNAKEDQLCFRAQGCPNCDTIVLLEFSLATNPTQDLFLGGGEFGILKNVSRAYGVGGTMFYGGDDYGERFGVRARVRRYLNRQIALDVGPGIVLTGDKNDGHRTFPAFSGQVAVDLFGMIAPVYQLEMEHTSIGTRWNSYFGARAESYAAPIAFLGIVAIAAASFSSSGW